jgi:competence protein ComEA
MKKQILFINLAIVLTLVFLFAGGVYAKDDAKKKTTAPKTAVTTSDTAKVNINKASEEELTRLVGIGPAKAEAIVKYRKDNGNFKNPEDLMNVTGIGEATFKKNKDRITVK